MRHSIIGLTAIGCLSLLVTTASAADPALSCEAGKLKESSKYSACLLKAQAKAVLKGVPADFTKCDDKFNAKFPATETKAGPGICPSEGDVGTVGQRIAWNADAVSEELAGGIATDPYSPATGQTTSYGTGDDGDVQAGAVQAFADNADGTITDRNTGLMWEKKVQGTGGYTQCTNETGTCANPHNADNVYTWTVNSAPYTDYNGTVKTIYLNQLNNRCDADTTLPCTVDADCAGPGGACGFAGHRDWRLPNKNELLNIIDNSTYLPALNVAFHGGSCGLACTDLADPACSCDASSDYWSATTVAYYPAFAWGVGTYGGGTGTNGKGNDLYVRAVRAGS